MTPPARTSAPPLTWLALLLSVTTGLVDAISVLGLGKVFTANMTGNVVFLGFAVVGTPGFHFPPYLAAMLFFLIGALIAGQTGRAQRGKPLRRWLLLAAMIETLALWLAAIIATGFDIASQSPSAALYAIITLTALAMGFRNATIRQLKIPEVTTTVLTLTLTGLAADSTLAGGTNLNWARRLGSVIAIFAGASLGAALVFHVGLVAPLILAGFLVLAGTAVCALHPASTQPIG
ncbi:YoaK family protein [Archangium lansingense]|uniref:YoaK family protein n=1 Tax=Archangium lansingense TaxID=2995310 RepID=A0ABT4AJF1_9BACT|nr:YoaK family protein [Archangium lansinium]MCY1081828.1 YoaK family protein [Archangium lansinium]